MTAWLAELDEAERETAVRTLRCPVCWAKPGRVCRYLNVTGVSHPERYAHTGRYLAAVRHGIVPPLPGGR